MAIWRADGANLKKVRFSWVHLSQGGWGSDMVFRKSPHAIFICLDIPGKTVLWEYDMVPYGCSSTFQRRFRRLHT